MPSHFTLTFFHVAIATVIFSHVKDDMFISHVKISCFRAKAHLEFRWYLYNNNFF